MALRAVRRIAGIVMRRRNKSDVSEKRPYLFVLYGYCFFFSKFEVILLSLSDRQNIRHRGGKRLPPGYEPCIHTRRATSYPLLFSSAVSASHFSRSKSALRVWPLPKPNFIIKHPSGATGSARIIRHYWRVPVVHPDARIDSRLDPRLCRAATIAEERANARSKARCWRYVKEALVASGVIDSYPKTNYASEAGKNWCGVMVLSACRCTTNSRRQLVRCWSLATAAGVML